MRSLIGELRDALDRRPHFFALQRDASAVLLRQHRSKSGKLPVSLRLISSLSPNWKNR